MVNLRTVHRGVTVLFFLSLLQSVSSSSVPPTAPSFVVVVELKQLIAVTSPSAAYWRGRALRELSQSVSEMRAVTNPRDRSRPASFGIQRRAWLGKALRVWEGLCGAVCGIIPLKNRLDYIRRLIRVRGRVSCFLSIRTAVNVCITDFKKSQRNQTTADINFTPVTFFSLSVT